VYTTNLAPDQPLPIIIQPAVDGLDLIKWAAAQQAYLTDLLARHGGILFRNFAVRTVDQFEQFVGATTNSALLEYTYRSTPRSQVSGNIYTSTEYPSDQVIPFHNELSYARAWPLKIWFFCVTPALEGGATPIADSRKVYARIPDSVKTPFIEKGVMYVRNYGEGLDLPWQNVFQTNDRSAVEAFCNSAGIMYEWKGGDRLRTTQVCQAVARSPRTGEMVWFNQAHLFHASSLPPAVYAMLLAEFQAHELPRHTFYGDGSPIPADALEAIRQAYEAESVTFTWHVGDILMLDNMLVAHGRAPFSGPRKIVVGMAEMVEDETESYSK
jgi:alpha-ketoglutarate-dependent taurine dioxygenase